MTNYQLKQFNFFKKQILYNLPDILKDRDLLICSNDDADYIFMADKSGWIYVFDSQFKMKKFPTSTSEELLTSRVSKLHYIKGKGLITIKESEQDSEPPILEIWRISDIIDEKLDDGYLTFQKTRACRISIQKPSSSPFPITAISASEDLTQVAIGFGNGLLILVKGNVINDKNIKQTVIYQSEEPITNLHFTKPKTLNGISILYATTTSQILFFNMLQKGEKRVLLEARGCSMGCTDVTRSGELIVAQEEAIYFYTTDGRGPCFAFEGPKYSIKVYGKYLLISTYNSISNESVQANSFTTNISNAETLPSSDFFFIFDIKNKLIASRTLIPGGLRDTVISWNSIFVFGNLGTVGYFEEIDFRSKIELAIKQNMYSVAINLTQQSNEDNKPNLIAQIHLQHGDHLMERNEPELAVIEYISTIGQIDPSFVIVKLLDTQYLSMLISYLEHLENQGISNNEHTLLLLTCYSKLGNDPKLIEFLDSKLKTSSDSSESDIQLDVEKAIQICSKEGHYRTALLIAKRFSNTLAVFDILMYKLFDYNGTITYLKTLMEQVDSDNNDEKLVIQQYIFSCGRSILANAPIDFTLFLVELCINHRILPGKFKSLFVGYPRYLVLFYEKFIYLKYGYEILNLPMDFSPAGSLAESGAGNVQSTGSPTSSNLTNNSDEIGPPHTRDHLIIFNDLLELYLLGTESPSATNTIPSSGSSMSDIGSSEQSLNINREKALKILNIFSNQMDSSIENASGVFDYDYIYMLCKQEDFEEGLLFLLKAQEDKNADRLLLFYFDQLKSIDEKVSFDKCINYILDLIDKHAKDSSLASKKLLKLALTNFAVYPCNSTDFEYDVIKRLVIKILEFAKQRKILSPVEVFGVLENSLSLQGSEHSDTSCIITLEMLKPYLTTSFNEENESINKSLKQIEAYKEDVLKYTKAVNSLIYEPIIFDPPKKCALCLTPLSLPTVNFFCKHIYHLRCLSNDGSSEDSLECPICKANQALVQDNYHNATRTSSISNYNSFVSQLTNLESNETEFDILVNWLSKSSF